METLKDVKYAIGTNFSIKDAVADGGSITLKDFKPIFNATIIEKLNNAGANFKQIDIPEFGVSNKKINKIADAVALNECEFGIGTDTNGIIRSSANELGIIGYKPTYGLISRFGIYAVAGAFDTAGIYAKSVNDVRLVANTIKGKDINDMNSLTSEEFKEESISPKLFYIKELVNDEFITSLSELNIDVKEESLDINLISAIKTIYTCIMSAEMTTTLANITGIPFGLKGEGRDADEMMINCRSNFTTEIKTHLILGTYSLLKEQLNDYYHNSLRLRGLIYNEFNKLFNKYDGVVGLCDENNLLIANLCGYPSIAINKLLITSAQKEDNKLLNIASFFEGGK